MVDFGSFNTNLSATEIIISSKYNFSFPDLEAVDVSPSDIMVSVLQARVIAEGICRYIVLQERLVKDEKNIRTATLKVYIDDIIRPSLIVPKTIVSHLATIQGISNLAVHYQIEGRLSKKECYIALESLEQVVEWFVIKYEKDNNVNHKWKISTDSLNSSGAIPPKAEGCIISRSRDVENIRRIIISNKTILLRGNTGVGKTELVKDYINKYKRKYDGIYYSENVDDVDSFVYNLPIGIMKEESKAKNEIISEKLSVLHAMETPYLFVVDNFIGPFDSMKKVLPSESDTYHLIVVVIDEVETHNEFENYIVEPFSLEDSKLIFKYFCDINYDDTLITELLTYLSLNPRAIRMSAAFLMDNEKFTISMLLDSMKRNSSVQNIISNLYLIMTDISIIESNPTAKIVSGLLSLLPYTGVSLERFKSLMLQPEEKNVDEHTVDDMILHLQKSGWIAIDNMGSISMNPLLSDTIYERIHPSLSDPYVISFIMPILKPIKDIRDLYIQQIVALEPFVDHLTKRIDAADSCDFDILKVIVKKCVGKGLSCFLLYDRRAMM